MHFIIQELTGIDYSYIYKYKYIMEFLLCGKEKMQIESKCMHPFEDLCYNTTHYHTCLVSCFQNHQDNYVQLRVLGKFGKLHYKIHSNVFKI